MAVKTDSLNLDVTALQGTFNKLESDNFEFLCTDDVSALIAHHDQILDITRQRVIAALHHHARQTIIAMKRSHHSRFSTENIYRYLKKLSIASSVAIHDHQELREQLAKGLEDRIVSLEDDCPRELQQLDDLGQSIIDYAKEFDIPVDAALKTRIRKADRQKLAISVAHAIDELAKGESSKPWDRDVRLPPSRAEIREVATRLYIPFSDKDEERMRDGELKRLQNILRIELELSQDIAWLPTYASKIAGLRKFAAGYGLTNFFDQLINDEHA